MADGRDGIRFDPYQGFRFSVIVDGFTKMGFQTISGLREETEIVEYREGDDPSTMRKLPGLTSYDNLTLEEGISQSTDFVSWREQVIKIKDERRTATGGDVKLSGTPLSNLRRSMAIRLFDKGGAVVRTWEVIKAWPSALEVGDLDAESSDVLIETLEIAHEGLRQIPAVGSETSVPR